MTEANPPIGPSDWVERYGDYLFAYAVSRVRDEVLAEKLLQETFLSAIQNSASCAGDYTEKTWLTEILKSKLIDHFRQRSASSGSIPSESSLDDYQYLFADKDWKDHWSPEKMPIEWNGTPEIAAREAAFCGVLSHCLGELPERVANAFTLREMEGISGPEVCDILNLTKEDYWMMLHRARMHLRRCLENDWFRKKDLAKEIH